MKSNTKAMHDAAQKTEAIHQEPGPFTLLCVDDEANILSSLKRLFRPHGYRIFTAESGKQGLDILEQETVDLVISDMRMPEMNGAQFLERAREKWPDTVRILLTGYAEISAAIDAINKGQIYQYISKPWEDADILLLVKQALERKTLEREKKRLEALTQRQNEELKELNTSLEQKVQDRTAELRQTMDFLNLAHEKLKKGFLTSIQVFSNLIELREGALAGHSRRVADLAHKIAKQMGMSVLEAQDVLVAGLLHDIGKLGLPDDLLKKPFSSLTLEQRSEVIKHPARGQAALMALEQLKGAARLIRGHHERFDGMGYPDGLAGEDIPLGARILALANDYDSLQIGSMEDRRFTVDDAAAFIKRNCGKYYDPQVVDAFFLVTGLKASPPPSSGTRELAVRVADLEPGMILARDIMTDDGMLLLSKDYLLDEDLISQLANFEENDDKPLRIFIKAGRR